MNLEQGIKLVLNGSKAFHSRLISVFGQMALRLDDEKYLMTTENLKLSRLESEDVGVYDISTGDIGAIFRARPDINAIVIAVTADSVEVSKRGPLAATLDDLAMLIGPDVPVAKNSDPKTILKAISNRGGCFIEGLGIIGVGKNMQEAAAAVQIIEKAAEAEIKGSLIGGSKKIDAKVADSLRQYHIENYSIVNSDDYVNFVGFDENEFSLRNSLIEYGKKMCKDDLVYGSWGNLSVKLNDEEMLITPSGMDYFDIKPEDIVKVNITSLESKDARKPSTESLLHAAMYRYLPNCGAIMHTHSNGCSVFAAAQAGFVIEDPALHEIIGDVLAADYAPSGTKQLAINAVSTLQHTHAAILANHGAIFYGPTLDVVLAVANAVEAKACNLLGYGRSEEDA